MPFLLELAKELVNNHEVPIHDHIVVLPTRRSCLYFQAQISSLFSVPKFLPKVQSIEEFISALSESIVPDQHTLLLGLFRVWNKQEGEAWELEEFMEVAPMILRDFDHIDSSLVKGKELFGQLEAESSIKRWAEELGKVPKTDTPMVQDHFSFWERVKKVYPEYRQMLEGQGQAYKGMEFRKIAEELDTYKKYFEGKQIIIAGFNSLSKAERKIVFQLRDRYRAGLFWDSKREYIDDIDQEAGRYLREYEKIGQLETLGSARFSKKQKIDIYESQGLSAQARMAWQLVSKHFSSVSFEDHEDSNNWLALVLPDEKMLFPLLESMPSKIKDENGREIELTGQLNITMGLNFEDSSLRVLLESLFQILEKNPTSIYFKDLMRILSDPIFSSHPGTSNSIAEIFQKIKKNKVLKIDGSFIKPFDPVGKIRKIFFPELKSDLTFFEEYLRSLFSNWFEKDRKEPGFEINRLFFEKALEVAKKTRLVFEKEKFDFQFKPYSSFFFKALYPYSIPFSGQPLKPLHIMGILETRTLDFENVIILSCNEGIIPRGRFLHSMIPHFLSKVFELPTFEDFDSSSAYSFFRLFNEPASVELIYSMESDEMYRAEPSRFLLQISNLWKSKPEKVLSEFTQEFDLSEISNEMGFSVPKTEDILNRTLSFLVGDGKFSKRARGLSPSTLTQYLYNPLNFFENKILEVQEDENLEMELDPMMVGTLLHAFLEKSLKKFEGGPIDYQKLGMLLKDKGALEKIFEDVLSRKISNYSRTHGYSFIQVEMAGNLVKEYLEKILKAEDKFSIVGLERNLKTKVELETKRAGTVEIILKGQVDRIDKTRNGYRILDYKSGSKRSGEMKAGTWQELLEDGGKAKILQLMIYKYLWIREEANTGKLPLLDSQDSKSEIRVDSGIHFFGGGSELFEFYKVDDEPEEVEAFLSYMEKILSVVIDHMLDPKYDISEEQPF
jgi:ATP-dependent helicase/nuclease subunit B